MDLPGETWHIAIDTGGTFTDCVAVSPTGDTVNLKVLSNGTLRGRIKKQLSGKSFEITAQWPVNSDIFSGFQFRTLKSELEGMVNHVDLETNTLHLHQDLSGLTEGEDFEITTGEEVPVFACRIITGTGIKSELPPIQMRLGTTRGTNALLERKGAKVAFVTTAGFTDILDIGSQQRPDLFALEVKKKRGLYSQVFTVTERLNASGEILLAPTSTEMEAVAEQITNSGCDAVAIAFLHSYLNPVHEVALAKLVKEQGIVYVSPSANISRSIKFVNRCETAVVNAYLSPIIDSYVSSIQGALGQKSLKIMTSAGGLVSSSNFFPKDSLLSGPAGGIVGAVSEARKNNRHQIITFDMGGTSTDVARYDRDFVYRYNLKVGDATLTTPALAIETIAAGGGSICSFDGHSFKVGPESAGAMPGPACYGAGGPLTITDVNLLLGRLVPSNFSIPVDIRSSQNTLEELASNLIATGGNSISKEDILLGFLDIANEKMAEAIRKISIQEGYDLEEYTLLAFGGAGGQHACAIAQHLGIKEIILPYQAGILSAVGIRNAAIERFEKKQILELWKNVEDSISQEIEILTTKVITNLSEEGFDVKDISTKVHLHLRFIGQESSIEVQLSEKTVLEEFQHKYKKLYGHWLTDRDIELESITVIGSAFKAPEESSTRKSETHKPETSGYSRVYTSNGWSEVPIFNWEALSAGATIQGPAIILSRTSGAYVEGGWHFVLDKSNNAVLTKKSDTVQRNDQAKPEAALLELFTNRFTAIAEEMGALLQRTAFSVNVKERLDFSCGVLDPNGKLVVNAPHIPVHLGGLGICVRETLKEIDIGRGDIIITNHPAYGGSHLPDITLIAGAFDSSGNVIGYVANRAHHAEIGGLTPGSMPHNATNLEQEGVVIAPMHLVKNSVALWDDIESLFTEAPFPTRSWEENRADLNGAIASIKSGVGGLEALAGKNGRDTVLNYMNKLGTYAAEMLLDKLSGLSSDSFESEEYLDDDSVLKVNIKFDGRRLTIDFNGTSPVNKSNLNATPAIVNSVIIYVLRLLAKTEIPLNEGLMDIVDIKLPPSLLSPDFGADSTLCPAVVGGNTEISQRLTDTLLKAFDVVACSQGTMNNLLFGNEKFAYYETICGGTGAGPGFHGSDAVHQHMTNTKITDPEIMELKYPVTLERFEIRENSGGKGKWNGGNGVVREISFNESLILTLLMQHRKHAPYGLAGGGAGQTGEQYLIGSSGESQNLEGVASLQVDEGDRILIKTPGGGGYGSKPD